ncbi:MAG: hypothetical protein DLM69_00190 [Candidatus Chloroheliales bacterium]|nr:MAG: hypothetical protein DLM69_00190 [Chloroflexota bacterium]
MPRREKVKQTGAHDEGASQQDAVVSASLDAEVDGPEADLLGWYQTAASVAKYIVTEATTPLTLGIQGNWGSGKTSFIKLIIRGFADMQKSGKDEQHIYHDTSVEGADYELRYYKCLKTGDNIAHIYVMSFNCWLYAQGDYDVDEIFLLYVSRTLSTHPQLKPIINAPQGLRDTAKNVTRAIVPGILKSITKKLTGDDEDAEEYGQTVSDATTALLGGTPPDKLMSELSKLKKKFSEVVAALLKCKGTADNNRLVIVIDDLDRVEPVKAVETIEKLKVFLDVPGVVFFIAADLGVIEHGLVQKFNKEGGTYYGKNYLDKIVQIRYQLPLLQPSQTLAIMKEHDKFVEAVGLSGDPSDQQAFNTEAFKLIWYLPGIGTNIRTIHRVLLNFEFIWSLTKSAGRAVGTSEAICLLALLVMDQYSRQLVELFYTWNTLGQASINLTLEAGKLFPNAQKEMERFLRLIQDMGYKVEDWQKAFAYATPITGISGFIKGESGASVKVI